MGGCASDEYATNTGLIGTRAVMDETGKMSLDPPPSNDHYDWGTEHANQLRITNNILSDSINLLI